MRGGVLMHKEMMKMFKKSVPRPKKLYQSYMQECKVQNFSYNNFKKDNIILVELKEYLMSMDEYYYLSENQIDNIFNYLRMNLSLDNFNKMKKIYKSLNDLSDYLSTRYNSKNSLNGNISKDNCLYIIDKIQILKSDLAKKKGYNPMEIEKIISFENVIKKILNPKDYTFDENKFLYLVTNLPFLLNNDRNNKDFNDNFCRCLEKAKINREREKINYYKNMYSYLSTIKMLKLDDEYIISLLGINIQSVDQRTIDKKIQSMRIDSVTGLRQIEDYIVSIDTDITKKIDDAFSIEKIGSNYLLGIHIASVYSLGYFEEDSMDVNQKSNVKKANASLTKNKKRVAMTMYVLIDNNGMIRSIRTLNTVLKANANLVYEDVPHLLRNEDVNPELKETIVNLLSVYNLLENDKFPKNPTIQNFAYLITSKLMILCSCLYSEEFKKNEIPAIFLCGDSKDNYYSIDADEYYTGFNNYDTYTRITSPIYDRSSLINQYLVNTYIIPQRYIQEEEKDEMTLKLRPVINKLNKNKDKDIESLF